MNRSENAKRNIVSGLANNLISLLLPFVKRTIVIQLLGAEYLGLNGLFSSILQVLNLTEMGFGTAIVFSMYEPIAKNDTEQLCALLQYYKRIYAIIGTALFAGGLCVMPFLPSFIKGGWPEAVNIYWLYLICLLNTGISYFLFAYKNSLFTAYQRNDVLSKIHLFVKLFTSVLQISVLVFWKNYYAFAAASILGTVITNISVHFLSKKAFPKITCKGILSKEKKNEIKIKVKGLMINRLCQTSRNALDSIFISSFIGLIDTAKYNNYFFILTTVSGILNMVRESIIAGVGNSIVTESREKNHDDLLRLNFIYMGFAGWFAACLVCLYQPFTRLVFGEEMLFSYDIVVMFTLYFYLLKMGDIRYVYSEATGLWWENRYRAAVEAAANLILNYALGRLFGVQGIIAATLLSIFFCNFLWGSSIIYRLYFTDIRAGVFFKQHALYAVVTLLITSATYGCCSFVAQNGVVGFGVKAIICAVLPNILFLLIYRHTDRFQDAALWIDKRFHLPGFIRRVVIRQSP